MATDHFPAFAETVHKQVRKLFENGEVFVVDIDGDELYEQYLLSFPEGTNPIFRERTEHDCNTCKQFIRNVGNLVGITDRGVEMVWEPALLDAPYPYNDVAMHMCEAVASAMSERGIKDIFRTPEGAYGTKQTRRLPPLLESGRVETYNHFYTGPIPAPFKTNRAATQQGAYRTSVELLKRGMNELGPGAVDTVLELIDANALYRGTEHREKVVEFQKLQRAWVEADDDNVFFWANANSPAARFKNTVIGTLVADISNNVPLEKAVASFESKVAPHNYKRTTALITPGMVKEAMKTIKELDLEPALERRFARIDDISVNDVLWADASAAAQMRGGLMDDLLKHAAASLPPPKADNAVDIDMETFIKDVLPKTTAMEVMLDNKLLGNMMSLTAPVHDEPKQLFGWGNDFAWAYAGNIADSDIKARVKRAGGKVTDCYLRVSLGWNYADDLDIHVYGPRGSHIHYRDKRGKCGGVLDVDMNAHRIVNDPVENVTWNSPVDGQYRVIVNNFNRRTDAAGFEVEMEVDGRVETFSYGRKIPERGDVEVLTFSVKNGAVENVQPCAGIRSSSMPVEKWGLTTNSFVRVQAVTLSPNHWHGEAVGNKHTFFVLEGARNDEPTRGIFNEFLHPRLVQHRKVFEVIGEKTKCQPTEGQLSGVGFSSTKKATVLVKVMQGKSSRLYNVKTAA